jgi:hypothetical protein
MDIARKSPYCQDMRICIDYVAKKHSKVLKETTVLHSFGINLEEGSELVGFWTLTIVCYSTK